MWLRTNPERKDTMQKTEQDKVSVVEQSGEALEVYQSSNHLHGFGMVRLSAKDISLLQEGKMLACHDGEYATFVVLA